MKIFATDFDGTLRMKDGISEENILQIEKFRAQGNVFGVVTGRNYNNGYEIFREKFDFPFDFVIVSNGASAYDYDGNEIFSYRTDKDAKTDGTNLSVKLIEKCLELTDNPCGISVGKTNYAFHPHLRDGGNDDGAEYSPLSKLSDIESFVSANALCENSKECTKVVKQLKLLFGRYLNPVQNGRCIDITPKDVDKSYGIMTLAKHFGVKKEDIWTSGDNFNDISMLKDYHGCGMSTGVDEAKKVSEYVCASVAEALEIAMKS